MKLIVLCLLALFVCQAEMKKHHRHKKTHSADPTKPTAAPGKEGEEEKEPEKNATLVEKMIRQKGTFIIAYVDVK